jgi:hypothetical protein
MIRDNATYKDYVCPCTKESNGELYLIYMDPVSIIQEIESSFDEDVQFIPSKPMFLEDDWNDPNHDCESCKKCVDCEYLEEDEYHCKFRYTVCPKSCIECASTNDKKLKFLEKNHYSYDELWNLDSTIAKFILPRLIQFAKDPGGYPCGLSDEKEWKKILRTMIYFFKNKAKDVTPYAFPDSCEFTKMKEKLDRMGKDYFGKYLENLWD